MGLWYLHRSFPFPASVSLLILKVCLPRIYVGKVLYLFILSQSNRLCVRENFSVKVAWGNWWLIQWCRSEVFVSIFISHFSFSKRRWISSTDPFWGGLLVATWLCYRVRMRLELWNISIHVCCTYLTSFRCKMRSPFSFPRLGMRLGTLPLVRDSAWKSARVIVGVWLKYMSISSMIAHLCRESDSQRPQKGRRNAWKPNLYYFSSLSDISLIRTSHVLFVHVLLKFRLPVRFIVGVSWMSLKSNVRNNMHPVSFHCTFEFQTFVCNR